MDNEKLHQQLEAVQAENEELSQGVANLHEENRQLRKENDGIHKELLAKGEAITKLLEEVANVSGRYVEIKALTERLFPMLNKILDLLSKQQ